MPRIRSKLTFANVTSMIALLVALSGTALALQDNTVRSRHIVDHSIRSRDVRNVTYDDIVAQSGDKVHGVIGARDNVGTSLGSITALDSLGPTGAEVVLSNADITVDGGSDENSNVCQGSPSIPLAPPGMVCVYPTTITNATNIRGLEMAENGGFYGGFRIAWEPTGANQLSAVEATWGYTHP
jgi:hypothetical protein